jgi:hypothetical protein
MNLRIRIRTPKYLGNVDPDPYTKVGIRNPVVTSFENLLQASKGKKMLVSFYLRKQ